MRSIHLFWGAFAVWFSAGSVPAQTNEASSNRVTWPPMIAVQTTNALGLTTNGPTVMRLLRITQSWTNERPFPVPSPKIATNPSYLRMLKARMNANSSFSWTNEVFESFRPESLNYTVWTNFLTLTNGRDMQIWSERTHPKDWPTNRPSVRWNTNSVIWGMKGLTALSPCWQCEGFSGQVPLTALTRRHAYTRGHGLGPEGLNTHIAGVKAWFLTRDNVLVEAVVKRHVTRASTTNGVHRDYTVVLFDRDLPETIDVMSSASLPEIQSKYRFNCPAPVFQTEQGGFVSTGIAPLVVNTWKPGDSGSPNMIPLPGELLFYSGRSTTGPSREMQEDMNELCRLEHLDPGQYQLRRANLSKYPDY